MQSALRVCANLLLRELLFILQWLYREYPLVLVKGQHLFRSDARPLIRPALASGDGVLNLKSWRAPYASVVRLSGSAPVCLIQSLAV